MTQESHKSRRVGKFIYNLIYFRKLAIMTEFCAKLRGHDLLNQLRSGTAGPITHADLSNCNLTEFPPELFQLKDSLEILNLGENHLSSLPDNIFEFTKLRVMFFFESFPICLGGLDSLYMISFKSNKLQEIAEQR